MRPVPAPNPGAPTRSYLDHAATTDLRDCARLAWLEASAGTGNASSLHAAGRRARGLLEDARESVAADLDCDPVEVLFTSGGTEADNLAVLGQARARGRGVLVAVGATEHHSVLDAADALAAAGQARVETIPVDAVGVPETAAVERVLAGADEAVVSLMLANNEIGTVTPVAQYAEIAARHGAALHTDAVQAVGHLPIDVRALGVSSLSVSGHKFGAPRGTGALVLARDARCVAVGFGGGQERELRSGTVDVPGAAALAAALREATAEQSAEATRLAALRDHLWSVIAAAVPRARLSGPDPADPLAPGRLPGNLHVVFPGCAADVLLMVLDGAGIDVSTGSACTAGVAGPSHVVLATGGSARDARSGLRFSLGRTSTSGDVRAVAAVIGEAVARAREAGMEALAEGA